MSIAREFLDRGTLRGGTLILEPSIALAMIARAEDLGVRIVGIDGFWVTGSTVQPDMGNSIDLGSGTPTSWSEAAEFIRERADVGLMFEVVAHEDTRDLRMLRDDRTEPTKD